ncbi:hypothetical protein [Vibrio phage XZ1]|nr:hypothetical protein [Vibrio phage XZ1]
MFLVRMHEQQENEALEILRSRLEELGITEKSLNHRATLLDDEIGQFRYDDLTDYNLPHRYEAIVSVRGYDWKIGCDLNLKGR